VESPQVECRYRVPPSIVPCCGVIPVALTALMPFLVDLGEYPDACPKPYDTFVDVL